MVKAFPNILLIGASHGNELLGPKLFSHLLQHRKEVLEYVDMLIGNPRAFAACKRYIESDINRSYNTTLDTYESRRADYIKNYIAVNKPDLVIDFHTTTAVQPNCLITSTINDGETRRYLRASRVNRIIVVRPLCDITEVASHFVAYEIPNDNINTALLGTICDDIMRFVRSEVASNNKVVYQMQGKILTNDSDILSSRDNFVYRKDLHYTPSFIGEKAYKEDGTYIGFMLSEPREISL
mgnify:FL=1